MRMRFGAIAAGVCAAALLSAAIAGAKTGKLTLKGVITNTEHVGSENAPKVIGALYQGSKKVGKLNWATVCETSDCTEVGFVHVKGYKLPGEKSGTLYLDVDAKLKDLGREPATKSATGLLCVAQGRGNAGHPAGCVKASLTPSLPGDKVGTHFKLVVG
jgi:hypothetical protein